MISNTNVRVQHEVNTSVSSEVSCSNEVLSSQNVPPLKAEDANTLSIKFDKDAHEFKNCKDENESSVSSHSSFPKPLVTSVYQPQKQDVYREIHDINASAQIHLGYDPKNSKKMSFLKLHRRQLGEATRAPIVHITTRRSALASTRTASQLSLARNNPSYIGGDFSRGPNRGSTQQVTPVVINGGSLVTNNNGSRTLNRLSSSQSLNRKSSYQSVQRIHGSGVTVTGTIIGNASADSGPSSRENNSHANSKSHVQRTQSDRSKSSLNFSDAGSGFLTLNQPTQMTANVELVPSRTVLPSRNNNVDIFTSNGEATNTKVRRNSDYTSTSQNGHGKGLSSTPSQSYVAFTSENAAGYISDSRSISGFGMRSGSGSGTGSTPISPVTSPKPHKASKLGRHLSSTAIMGFDGTVDLENAPDDSDIVFMMIDLTSYMQKGATFIKYGRKGSPHALFFRLLKNNQGITWTSANKKKQSADCLVRFEWITEFVMGQKTKTFLRHPYPALEQLSVSLIYLRPRGWSEDMKGTYHAQCKAHGTEERTLDFIIEDPNEFTIWIQGMKCLHEVAVKQKSLQALSPMHKETNQSELLAEYILDETTEVISTLPILTGFPSCMFIKDHETGIDAEDMVSESKKQASADKKKLAVDQMVQGKYRGPLADLQLAQQMQATQLTQSTQSSQGRSLQNSLPAGAGNSTICGKFDPGEVELHDIFGGLGSENPYSHDHNATAIYANNGLRPIAGNPQGSASFPSSLPSLLRPVEEWELYRRSQAIRILDHSDILHPSWLRQIIALGPKTASLHPWRKSYSLLESGASYKQMLQGYDETRKKTNRSLLRGDSDDSDPHGVYSVPIGSAPGSALTSPITSPTEGDLQTQRNLRRQLSSPPPVSGFDGVTDTTIDGTMGNVRSLPGSVQSTVYGTIYGSNYNSTLSSSMGMSRSRTPPPPFSILLLSDSDGRVFGGFATQKWSTKPDTFYGDPSCFVFSVIPDNLLTEDVLAEAQLTSTSTSTAADVQGALQIGGQLDVYKFAGDDAFRFFQFTSESGFGFGSGGSYPDMGVGSAIFVDNFLSGGVSKPCPVFDSPRLSGKEDFRCYVLELWTPSP